MSHPIELKDVGPWNPLETSAGTAEVCLIGVQTDELSVALVRMQPESALILHTHPTAETIRLIDGGVYASCGERKWTELAVGKELTVPAGVPHTVSTRFEEALLLVSFDGRISRETVDAKYAPITAEEVDEI